MVISHKYKFIFIKTTKTAGTSLEVFLSNVCGDDDVVTPIFPHVEPHRARNYEEGGFYNHIPGHEIKKKVSKDTWDSYFVFCFERNPWDKVLSHYHMVNGRSDRDIGLDEYFEKGNFPCDYHKYTDLNGEVIVDKVFSYENINNDLVDLFGMLGIPFNGELIYRAKSEYRKDRRSYRDVLSFDQSSTVKDVFSKEIKILGYKC